MNRKTRPICHGRMGKGNNRCSRVIVRVLTESLLGAVKANRDVTIRRLHLALLLLQFQCTQLWINLPEKLEITTGIWPFQYEPVADINRRTGRVSSDEEMS